MPAVPARAPDPTGSIILNATDDARRHPVVVTVRGLELHENLIEHDIVQDACVSGDLEPIRDPARKRAAPIDQLFHA